MEIEEDFFHLFKGSDLGKAIKGNIYRWGMRPDNAKTEDAVVHFLNGTGAQLQRGVVIINVYVNDISLSDGRLVSDLTRLTELGKLVYPMIWDDDSDYVITEDEVPVNTRIEGTEQTCMSIRLRFNRMAS